MVFDRTTTAEAVHFAVHCRRWAISRTAIKSKFQSLRSVTPPINPNRNSPLPFNSEEEKKMKRPRFAVFVHAGAPFPIKQSTSLCFRDVKWNSRKTMARKINRISKSGARQGEIISHNFDIGYALKWSVETWYIFIFLIIFVLFIFYSIICVLIITKLKILKRRQRGRKRKNIS